MKQSIVRAPDFVRASKPERLLICTAVLLLMTTALLPRAHAQGLDEMAFGIRFEVPLFSAHPAADGIKSFVGFIPRRTTGISLGEAPPMLGVQLTGHGGIKDAWVANLARKKKIFLFAVTTALAIGTYLVTSDDTSKNKAVTALNRYRLGCPWLYCRGGKMKNKAVVGLMR